MPGNTAESFRHFSPAHPEGMYGMQSPETRVAAQIHEPQKIFFRADANGVALGLVRTQSVTHDLELPSSTRDFVYKFASSDQSPKPKYWDRTASPVEHVLQDGLWTPVVRQQPTRTSFESHMLLLWQDNPQEGKEAKWGVVFDNVSPSQDKTTVDKFVNEWRDAHGLNFDLLDMGVVARPTDKEENTFALIARVGDAPLLSWEYTVEESQRRTSDGPAGFSVRPVLKDFKRVDMNTMRDEISALKQHAYQYAVKQ